MGWKKSCGLGIGALLLLGVVGGSGAGCNSENSFDPGVCELKVSGALTYREPLHFTGQCTDNQLASFVEACLDPTKGSKGACDVFLDLAANEACARNCLFPDPAVNTTNFGAFLRAYVNKPGYLSFQPGVTPACVAAYHDAYYCDVLACEDCGGTAATACDERVLGPGGQCEVAYKAYKEACPGTDAIFTKMNDDVTKRPLAVVNEFCGRPALDAGIDSGAGDAGDDASTDASMDADG